MTETDFEVDGVGCDVDGEWEAGMVAVGVGGNVADGGREGVLGRVEEWVWAEWVVVCGSDVVGVDAPVVERGMVMEGVWLWERDDVATKEGEDDGGWDKVRGLDGVRVWDLVGVCRDTVEEGGSDKVSWWVNVMDIEVVEVGVFDVDFDCVKDAV